MAARRRLRAPVQILEFLIYTTRRTILTGDESDLKSFHPVSSSG